MNDMMQYWQQEWDRWHEEIKLWRDILKPGELNDNTFSTESGDFLYNSKGELIGISANKSKNKTVFFSFSTSSKYLSPEETSTTISTGVFFGTITNVSAKIHLYNEELNTRAILSMIRVAESGRKNRYPLPYNAYNKGRLFTNESYEDHPEDYKKHPKRTETEPNSASGAYQIVEGTYNRFIEWEKHRNANMEDKEIDFSPMMQDKAAVYLIYVVRKAKKEAISGDIKGLVKKNKLEWDAFRYWRVDELESIFNAFRVQEMMGNTILYTKIGSLLI